MANPIQREKMYEALAFFSANVRHAGQLKLFKLLYYLDLMHLRRTGRPVTGLVYEAWPKGPVPPELNNEFKDTDSELRQRFAVTPYRRGDDRLTSSTIDSDPDELERAAGNARVTSHLIPSRIKARRPYEHRYLTRREQKLAEVLAEVFRDATAAEMSDISHHKFGPWRKALFKSKKTGIPRPEIDFLEGVVAVGKPEDELPPSELREIVAEHRRIEELLR